MSKLSPFSPSQAKAIRLPSGVTVSSGFRSADAATYHDLYEASYQDLPMSFVRDEQWWASGCERLSLLLGADGPDRLSGIAVDGQLVGYAIMHHDRIIEATADPSAQELVAQTIAARASRRVGEDAGDARRSRFLKMFQKLSSPRSRRQTTLRSSMGPSSQGGLICENHPNTQMRKARSGT